MEKQNYTKIEERQYLDIRSRIDSMVRKEDIIDTCEYLKDKCYSERNTSCLYDFIFEILTRDFGRSFVYDYNKGAAEFIQSKYLSDYFKGIIKYVLSDEKLSEDVQNVLNSDKSFNAMTEEDIKGISDALDALYKREEKHKMYIRRLFFHYIIKLEGKGVIDFVKNNVDPTTLATDILHLIGLNDRASFYALSGMDHMESKKLIRAFEKLLRYDVNYALGFFKTVTSMKKLPTKDFIETFLNLSANHFVYHPTVISQNGLCLDKTSDAARNASAIAIACVRAGSKDELDGDVRMSRHIIGDFVASVKPVILAINPNYNFGDIEEYEERSRKRM